MGLARLAMNRRESYDLTGSCVTIYGGLIMDEKQVVTSKNTTQDKTMAARIDALNTLAWELSTSEPERALDLAIEAQKLARASDFAGAPYVRGLVAALCTQGALNLRSQECDLAFSQSLEALSLAQTHQLRDLMPRVLSNLAALNFLFGNYSEALDLALRQLELSDELDNVQQKARASLSIGAIYAQLGDYEKAQAYFADSLAVFRHLRQPYWMALALTNLAETYQQVRDFSAALSAVEEALQVARERDVHKRVYIVALTNRGEIFLSMANYEQALAEFEQARKLAKASGQPELEADALLALGKVYLELGRVDEAIGALQTAVSLGSEIGYKNLIFSAHEKLAAAYQQQEAYGLALTHYKQFHAVRETVFNEETSRKIRNLEVMQRTQVTQKEADLYANLYEQEQARRLLAETLQEVGRTLTSTLELDVVLQQILMQLEPLVPYDRSSLLLKQGDHLEFMAVRGFPDDEGFLAEGVPLSPPKPNDVFFTIYQSKRPLALADVANFPGWRQVADLPIPGAWLGVPMIHNDEVIGMLSLVREEALPFNDESIAVATTFASQAVIALQNARLYDYARRFNEQLEYEVRQRTRALREAYERLERLDQAKSDFINVTAHELRTPITVVKGYSQLLQKLPKLMVEEQPARLINGIAAGVDRLQAIVNTMLLMVKIDSQSLKVYPEPLVLYEILGEVVVGLTGDLAERQQTIVLDDGLQLLPQVQADEDLLRALFRHLLVNAIKYTPDGGHIVINGRAWAEPPEFDWPDKGIEIVVRDTGIGILPAELSLIFDKFYRAGSASLHSSGQTKFKGGGPGLGLTIAQGIVAAHKGRIWAESPGYDEETCPGASFHVVLPLGDSTNGAKNP